MLPDFKQVIAIGGSAPDLDRGGAIALDDDRNTYVGGSFSNSIERGGRATDVLTGTGTWFRLPPAKDAGSPAARDISPI